MSGLGTSTSGTSGPVRIFLLLGLAVFALFPLVGSTFYVQLGTKVMIFAILAMSLNLLVGFTGLVSLGHAAFFGLAAYSVYMFTPGFTAASLWWTLPAAMVVTGVAALIIGALSLRTKGIFFLMVTLAFGQMVFFLFHDTPLGGSPDGVYINAAPTLDALGVDLPELRDRYQLVDGGARAPFTFYYVTLGIMLVVYLLLAGLLKSLFGHVIQGIRVNEHRMRALGYPVYTYKLASFVIAGMFGGLAGYLWAVQSLFVNPELASWHMSAEILLMVILGGMGTLYGPILGALALEALRELAEIAIEETVVLTNAIGLTDMDPLRAATDYYLLVEGVVIIAIVIVVPRGLSGLIEDLANRRRSARISGQTDAERAA
ncbi:MAG: branched-chain amino acid ABC transporter permease [Pseudomonadota bacterium]